MLPRLMYERLEVSRHRLCVVYPTAGLGYHRMPDARLRRAICRAYNVFTADQFRGLDDRVIPAAIIPMYTPEEAIEEIEFVSKQLGYKVIMVGGLMRRPVPAVAEENPDASRFVEWYDVVGLDSPTTMIPCGRSSGSCASRRASITRRLDPAPHSPSNFFYNHIVHRLGRHAVARRCSRRRHPPVPDLNFAFLEGGWLGVHALPDLIGHWENATARDPSTHPASSIAPSSPARGAVRPRGDGRRRSPRRGWTGPGHSRGVEDVDDYFRCRSSAGNIRDLFVPRYYFGSRGADPVNTWAFNRKANPMNARLNASSARTRHFDVRHDRVVPRPTSWSSTA